MKIYISEPIDGDAYRLLSSHFSLTDTFSDAEEIVGILSRNLLLTREQIEALPNLKVISVHGSGVDGIDLEAAAKHNIVITNTPGENAQSVAELAVSYMLSLARKLPYNMSGLKEGRFKQFGDPSMVGMELSHKKVGLIGTGAIAKRTAFILKNGFSCQVYAYNPHKTAAEIRAMGFLPVDSLEVLFRTVDIVSVHCPLTHETNNMINRALFEAANPGLIIVNTARGGIINETALYDALIHKKIKAAACDVFTTEPLSSSHPLLALDNFIATFHIGNATPEALSRVGMRAVQNIIDVLLPIH